MSYLPGQQAGYFEAIQVYFTELTERVSIFGARDRALLERWREEGRSAQVVCRGIREAVVDRDSDQAPPRSLRQCEYFIDRQWERLRERCAGVNQAPEEIREEETATEESGEEDRGDGGAKGGIVAHLRCAIEEAGRATDEERWREAYRQAWRAMDRIQRERDHFSFAEAEAVDRALVDAYLEALGEEERRAIEDSMLSSNGGMLEAMSPAAKREHLRIKTKQAIVERFGVLDIIDVLSR